jgi:hypothetical protein
MGMRSSENNKDLKTDDLYETPPKATLMLLSVLDPDYFAGKVVFECCAGLSAISNVLREKGMNVIERDLFHIDKDGVRNVDNRTEKIGYDFLDVIEPLPDFDCIITNPPYKLVCII